MPWFWYVATTNGLVQIRGEGFERLTATSNACAADGYLAVGAGLAAKGRLLIDYAQDSSRCIDQVPEGHVIEEIGPDGWLVIGPAPDDREPSTEATPRQLVHVGGGESVDLPDGASPGFYGEHVVFSDGEGEGAVFTVFPLEQFDPEGV